MLCTNLMKVGKDNLGPLPKAAMSAANPADPRSLWLNSSDALLQVLCCVAFCGHDTSNFSSLTRAFRGDEVLWGCIKDRRGPSGRTALMACSSSGNLSRVRWLLERGANVNAAQSFGWTSLMWACQKGHLEVVRELLGRGANVNASLNYTGRTSLIEASCAGYLEIVRELLGRGASVNAAETGTGKTSLMRACQAGHLEVVRELLGQGANVNASTIYIGWTPLMWTCTTGHLEVARLLLAHHAKKAPLDHLGRTAYDHTAASNTELRALVKP
jgi:ankyrin repeat protein